MRIVAIDPEIVQFALHYLKLAYPDLEVIEMSRKELNFDLINEVGLVLVNVGDVTPWTFFENPDKITAKLVVYFDECPNSYHRKSTYDYYNSESLTHNWELVANSGLMSQCVLRMSPSGQGLPVISDYAHIICTPYYLNPSVFNKYPFETIMDAIDNDLKIGSDRRGVTMNYRMGSPYRELFYKLVNKAAGPIHCGGKFHHNDDRLKPRSYDYNIVTDYLTKFKYSVAIENDFYSDYVSEKLIDPLLAGTVPIYYDPFNTNFPEWLINRDACIVVTDEVLNQGEDYTVDWLKESMSIDRSGVPVFSKDAKDNFCNYMITVRNTIKRIINERVIDCNY